MTKQEFLAFSLPYGLICDRIFYDIEELCKESGIHTIDGFDYEIYSDGGIFDLKPILHPLSDLTKEIEHKGEKFVPISNIHLADLDEYYGHCELDAMHFEIRTKPIEMIPFCFVKKLIEWHFDLFNGIESGEAINVKELEINPYK